MLKSPNIIGLKNPERVGLCYIHSAHAQLHTRHSSTPGCTQGEESPVNIDLSEIHAEVLALASFGWLPVSFRIDFKIFIICF